MSVVYLYGFVPEQARLPRGGLLGVGDVPVEILPFEGVAAAIGRPDPDHYSAGPLESRASDMTWMAEQGLRHEQVVAWFVDHSTILPSPLLTLFSSEAALREAVRERPGIRADLERFAGTREWDLKVAWDPAVLAGHLGEVSEDIAAVDRDIAGAGPGKRFLLERKRSDLARTEGRVVARRLATELLDDLRADAQDSVVLPPPPDGSPVVLSAALLLPAAAEADVVARAAAARDRLVGIGIAVTFTGPWAPYRFTGRADE